MSGRKIIVSAHEKKNGDWYGEVKQSLRVRNMHNGSELRVVLGDYLRMTPGHNALGQAIKDLQNLGAVVGYDSAATRDFSVDFTGKTDTFIAIASILNANNEAVLTDQELGEFQSEPFDTMKEAIAWVAGKLGHPALKAQIELLP